MRLALVTASLGRGGAERVMTILANAWAEQGRDIRIIVLNEEGEPAYPLHPAIHMQNLGLPSDRSWNPLQGLTRTIKKVSVLRGALRSLQPDLIISFIDYANILTLLAARVLRTPVIVSERIDPLYYRIGTVWEFLRRKTYPAASAVVCQTRVTLERFQHTIPLRGQVIPNPVILPEVSRVPRADLEPKRGHAVVAMGRLVPQKGFDLLLDAFARVAARHPDWTLKIAGAGPMLPDLQHQAEELNVRSRVVLKGVVNDPFTFFAGADLFVLSSRYEGFPNALCEAMASGLPVISFDCPAGPREIIRNGVDGLLAAPEDTNALAQCMNQLMSDPDLRGSMASRAPEVIHRFSRESVLAMWDALFHDVLHSPPHQPVTAA